MGLFVNGVNIDEGDNEVIINGVSVDNVYANGALVWQRKTFGGVWSGNSYYYSGPTGMETSGQSNRWRHGDHGSSPWNTATATYPFGSANAYYVDGGNSYGYIIRANYMKIRWGSNTQEGEVHFNPDSGWSGTSSVSGDYIGQKRIESSGFFIRFSQTASGEVDNGAWITLS